MKKINNFKRLKRLSVLAILTLPFISLGQWTEITPGSGSGGVKKIDCIDSTCFISGEQTDLVMKSTDGGQSWSNVGITASNGTGYLEMFNVDTVYVVRNSSLYRSYNGGTNWEEIPISYAIQDFINPYVGYALDGVATIYQTTDKGNTWTWLNTLPNQIVGVLKISFFSLQIGFISTFDSDRYCIYKTVNGGLSWTKVFEKISSTSAVLDMQMVTENVGYACGGSTEGLILKTIDGGNSWTELANPFQSVAGFTTLDFINTNSGYIIGGSTRILKTIDGGASWVDESYNTSYLYDVKIFDLQTVYIASLVNGPTSALLKNSSAGLVANIVEKGKNIGKIYPNPIIETVNIEIEKQDCIFNLFDANGRMLLDVKLEKGITSLNVSEYQSGFYTYQIYDNKGFVTNGKITKL